MNGFSQRIPAGKARAPSCGSTNSAFSFFFLLFSLSRPFSISDLYLNYYTSTITTLSSESPPYPIVPSKNRSFHHYYLVDSSVFSSHFNTRIRVYSLLVDRKHTPIHSGGEEEEETETRFESREMKSY